MTRSPAVTLSAAYAAAMGFSTAATALAAWKLPTPHFALLTAALILSALPPLLFAWGVADALTFAWLRDPRSLHVSVFTSALLSLVGMSALAVALAVILTARAGFSATLIWSTATLVAVALLNSGLQAVELALGATRLTSLFVPLGGLGNLIAFLVILVQGPLTADAVMSARAIAAAGLLVLRIGSVGILAPIATPSLGLVWTLVKRGTGIHVTALLAAGSLRVEQLFAVEWFSVNELAIYGLVMPVVAGVKQVQHGAATAVAVSLAKNNSSLSKVPGAMAPLLLLSLGLGALGWGAVWTFAAFVSPMDAFEPLGVLLLILGGILAGVTDSVVRCMRAVESLAPGIYGRIAALIVTTTIGPSMYMAGLLTASFVGLLAFLAAIAAIVVVSHFRIRREVRCAA